MNGIITPEFIQTLLFSIIRMSTPIIFASMGALVSRHAGINNIAIEGIMLTASLTGVAISALTQSVLLGVLGAMVGGVVIASILAYMGLVLKSEMMLTGVAINTMASGGTVFLLYLLSGDKGASHGLDSLVVPNVNIPIIKDIPFLGPVLSGHNILTYLAFIIVFVVAFLIYKTRIGLRIRSVGENPGAAKSVGINVTKTQFYSFILSGIFASLGGAFMSMGYLSFFSRDMIAGRGFIGMSAMNLANGRPFFTLLAAVVFGAADAISMILQGFKLPPEFVQMTPYLTTIVGLIFFSVYQQREENKRRQIESDKEGELNEP